MKCRLLGPVLATVVVATTAHATPTYFPGTGHWYEVVPELAGITWSDARAAAGARVWQGQSGYLACITSPQENDFVFQLTLGSGVWHHASIWEVGPWLGGFQLTGSEEPAGGWSWVSGEPWGYTNWLGGQPDDNGPPPAHEDFLCYWGWQQITPTWNDYINTPPEPGLILGYVVEYPTTPLPPTGACCFPAGVCLQGTQLDCQMAGGSYVGDGAACIPNPCAPVAVDTATWGRVKANYRQ